MQPHSPRGEEEQFLFGRASQNEKGTKKTPSVDFAMSVSPHFEKYSG